MSEWDNSCVILNEWDNRRVILSGAKDLTMNKSEKNIYYVYILTNWNNKVMYIGVTNNIVRRLYEHKNKLISGYTSKYNVNKLVYLEETDDINEAIRREKQLKGWKRERKNELVESINPEWKDMSEEMKDPSLRSG